MHVVQVDQSGRNDRTEAVTVLACANGMRYSILISANDKRTVLETLRQKKPQRSDTLIHVLVFSTLLYLLLKDHIENIALAMVDPEFVGYEALIKDRVMALCKRSGITMYKDQLTFHRVGKKSPAHQLAWEVFHGLVEPDKIVTAGEVLDEFGE